jgi:nucleoside-diphosphate-sugar epimerase
MNDEKLVLVTGATGFVGAYLVRLLLLKGYKVRGLKRPTSNFELLDGVHHLVDWVDADITDVVGLEDAFAGVTNVCHCAASISFHPRDVQRMHKTNVEGTANIVNLCLHFRVKSLIHISSIAALGRTKDRLDLDEKCQWVQSKDNSHYAITKNLAEQEVWRGMAEGLSVVIVSPSVIVGSRAWDQGMAAFFKKIDGGLKVFPSGQSGFVDVRDVVSFVELALRQGISGERYILNAVNLTHKEFFGMIARTLQVSPPYIKVGPLLVEVAWRVEWLKEKILGTKPLLTKESARASVTAFTYHNEKSLLVDHFQYKDFQQTISDVAAQYNFAKVNGFKVVTLAFQ